MAETTTFAGSIPKRAAACLLAVFAACAVMVGASMAPEEALADSTTPVNQMHRLYNPNSGEHFYTADASEKNYLVSVGWRYEGVGWYAPKSGADVYRLYNANAGDHHYTKDVNEKNYLVSVGWRYEGVGCKSGGGVTLLRQYNPNAVAGAHNYTASQSENDYLVRVGWRAEGAGWQGVFHEHAWQAVTKQVTQQVSQEVLAVYPSVHNISGANEIFKNACKDCPNYREFYYDANGNKIKADSPFMVFNNQDEANSFMIEFMSQYGVSLGQGSSIDFYPVTKTVTTGHVCSSCGATQ